MRIDDAIEIVLRNGSVVNPVFSPKTELIRDGNYIIIKDHFTNILPIYGWEIKNNPDDYECISEPLDIVDILKGILQEPTNVFISNDKIIDIDIGLLSLYFITNFDELLNKLPIYNWTIK